MFSCDLCACAVHSRRMLSRRRRRCVAFFSHVCVVVDYIRLVRECVRTRRKSAGKVTICEAGTYTYIHLPAMYIHMLCHFLFSVSGSSLSLQQMNTFAYFMQNTVECGGIRACVSTIDYRMCV